MQMIQLLDIQDTAAYVMDVTCRKMTAEPGRLRVDESGMGKSTCLKVNRHYARIE